MANARFKEHLSSMVDKGWSVTGHNDNVVDENFAQFFTYFPHNEHLVMGSMSVDRFYQFISDTKSALPAHHLERENLGAMVLETAYDTRGKKNPNAESLWALASALYMATTGTGNTVMTQFHGHPFAFFTVMYPTNKQQTNFAIRPASVAPLHQILSVEECKDYFSQIMASDKQQGKKLYFKYLKKR